MEKFYDRHDAGKILAQYLKSYAGKKGVIILALPRGGVPVAYEVAKTLQVPLDIFLVRKLGVPGHEELAMGAIAMQGGIVFNQDVIESHHISETTIHQVIQSEQVELKRREIAYRHNLPLPDLNNKIIILIDDGIATGATMRAAIAVLRQQKPARIVVAVPVAAASVCDDMEQLVDDFVCPLRPIYFHGVGAWYEDFAQTTDEEVKALYRRLSNVDHPL